MFAIPHHQGALALSLINDLGLEDALDFAAGQGWSGVLAEIYRSMSRPRGAGEKAWASTRPRNPGGGNRL